MLQPQFVNQEIGLQASSILLVYLAEGVHNLRSILKGHISGQTAEQIRLDAIKGFGSLRNHFNDLCERCHE